MESLWKAIESEVEEPPIFQLDRLDFQTAELLSTLEGAAYVVRRGLHAVREIRQAKKAIRTAFEVQKQGLGFALVELLSTCPTNWGLTPVEARDWVEERMMPVFPLGDYKISPKVAELKI